MNSEILVSFPDPLRGLGMSRGTYLYAVHAGMQLCFEIPMLAPQMQADQQAEEMRRRVEQWRRQKREEDVEEEQVREGLEIDP